MNVYLKVGVIIEDEAGRILLIKEKVDKDGPLAWNLVKGSFETSDGKLEECAKRESMEEAGLDVKVLGVHNIMFFHKPEALKVQYNLVARPLNMNISSPGSRGVSIEGENIQELKWMRPDDIAALKPEDFVADYTLGILQSWLKTKMLYPLKIIKYSDN